MLPVAAIPALATVLQRHSSDTELHRHRRRQRQRVIQLYWQNPFRSLRASPAQAVVTHRVNTKKCDLWPLEVSHDPALDGALPGQLNLVVTDNWHAGYAAAPDAVHGGRRLGSPTAPDHVPLATVSRHFVEPILLGDARRRAASTCATSPRNREPYHPFSAASGTLAMKNHVLRHHQMPSRWACPVPQARLERRLSRTVAPSYKAMDLVVAAQPVAEPAAEVMRPSADWLWRARSCSRTGQAQRLPRAVRSCTTAGPAALHRRGGRSSSFSTRARRSRFLTSSSCFPAASSLASSPPTSGCAASRRSRASFAPACDTGTSRAKATTPGLAFCVSAWAGSSSLRELRTLPGIELRLFELRWASPSHWSRRFEGRLNLLTDDADDYVIGA